MGLKIKLMFLLPVFVAFFFLFKTNSLANSCSCDVTGKVTANNCGTNITAKCEPRNTNNGVGFNCKCSINTGAGVSTSKNQVFCSGGNNEINTALGCIPVDMGGFTTKMLPFLFGIAGGISFLLMVYGFILISMSKGDPKAVQSGKETVTSAITGLLLSIFAIFILKLILINILHIPGIN